jgi:hypothetical protein
VQFGRLLLDMKKIYCGFSELNVVLSARCEGRNFKVMPFKEVLEQLSGCNRLILLYYKTEGRRVQSLLDELGSSVVEHQMLTTRLDFESESLYFQIPREGSQLTLDTPVTVFTVEVPVVV